MDTGDSAFWQFSLQFYRRPEVPALCLILQDQQGADINLLFFIFFMAVNGRQLTPDEVRRIDACICDWRKHIVQPLRALRRELKGGIAPIDRQTSETLRAAIQRDELLAERLQQEALERAFPLYTTGTSAAPGAAIIANIAAYGALAGTLPEAPVNKLLRSLMDEFSI